MIPITINKNREKYNLIKAYENFALYEGEKKGLKECFSFLELGTIKQPEIPDRKLKMR